MFPKKRLSLNIQSKYIKICRVIVKSINYETLTVSMSQVAFSFVEKTKNLVLNRFWGP